MKDKNTGMVLTPLEIVLSAAILIAVCAATVFLIRLKPSTIAIEVLNVIGVFLPCFFLMWYERFRETRRCRLRESCIREFYFDQTLEQRKSYSFYMLMQQVDSKYIIVDISPFILIIVFFITSYLFLSIEEFLGLSAISAMGLIYGRINAEIDNTNRIENLNENLYDYTKCLD
jgi:hypothetical protein